MAIKTVIFDIGRVLIGFEWDDYISKLFTPETAKAVSAVTFKGPYWKELDRGVMTTEEIFDAFIAKAPAYAPQIREALDKVGQCTTRTDYAIPWIQDLKSRGYQVLFLSNYSYYVQSVSQHALDFLPYMDGGIFSCDVKCIKPDEAIYELLFRKYDLKPEECIFIDDTAANIEAGIKLGMPGIVFKNYAQARADLDKHLTA